MGFRCPPPQPRKNTHRLQLFSQHQLYIISYKAIQAHSPRMAQRQQSAGAALLSAPNPYLDRYTHIYTSGIGWECALTALGTERLHGAWGRHQHIFSCHMFSELRSDMNLARFHYYSCAHSRWPQSRKMEGGFETSSSCVLKVVCEYTERRL